MTDVPRRLRPDPAKRSRTIQTQTHTAHSAQGSTAAARPVATRQRARPYVPPVAASGVVTGESSGPNSTSISQTTTNSGGASVASAGGAIAIGTDWSGGGPAGAQATAQNAVAIGGGASAASPSDTVVGVYANTDSTGGNSVAIGRGATVTGDGSAVAIGNDANVSAAHSVSIGENSSAAGPWATAVGASTVADGDESVAIGLSAKAHDGGGIALGFAAEGWGVNATVLGQGVVGASGAPADNAVAIGPGANAPNAYDFMLGSSNHNVQVQGRLNVARRTPANTADTQGAVGDITSDDSYVYVKTSAGWKRSALSTF